jgi:hypothetical protein
MAIAQLRPGKFVQVARLCLGEFAECKVSVSSDSY